MVYTNFFLRFKDPCPCLASMNDHPLVPLMIDEQALSLLTELFKGLG
jgi:hypothetical protein